MSNRDTRFIMVDVETDGPCPGLNSMIAIAAVVVEPELNRTFKRYVRAYETNSFQQEALNITGFSREQTLHAPEFIHPEQVMHEFAGWLRELGLSKIIFISDNNGFDWSFVNYYFWVWGFQNPFGFSSQNLNSIYKGQMGDMYASLKHLKKTKADHDPLNDAMGNAEAMLEIMDHMKTPWPGARYK